jgi:hypothetical protein
MLRSCIAFIFSLCSLCLCGEPSFAAGIPRLTRVTPPGGQRGTVVEVEFVGRGLDQPKDVLFYEPGITLASIEPVEKGIVNGREVAVEPGYRVKAKLKIAADCELGAHGLRLRTAGGLTEYARFFVGPFPTLEEIETPLKRNDKRDAAQPVPMNTTVLGRLIEPTDLDIYRIEAKQGQRISAEIEAHRLGVERGIPDLHLTITDSSGKKLAAADDSALFVQDPVLSILADRDGEYFIEVRHSMYNGTNDQYRLHVGTFSRPTAIFPAGGQAGSELKVRIIGDPKGEWTQSVKLPDTAGDLGFIAMADGVPAPTPNRLRVSPFPNVIEGEGDSVTSLPAAFNGIIAKPGETDSFRFRAKKGESFRFTAMANALGSPLNPAISIRPANAKGNSGLQRAADSTPAQHGFANPGGLMRETHDSVLEFTAGTDGEFVLAIEDERGEAGPDFVYRIEAAPATNPVYTSIASEPENQQQPQARQTIAVAPGNRMTCQVALFAGNRPFNGDLELVALNMPKGVTLHAPIIKTGVLRVPVVFEAAENAEPVGTLVDLVVRPVGGSESSLPSGFRQTIALNGYGNNDYYLHVPVEKLAVAVTEAAPFSLKVEEPKTALVQNGETGLKFSVNRRKGFDGPVTVQMDLRPLGINTATPVTLAAGQTEGVYILGAARNAAAGKHQVVLTASTGTARRGGEDVRTLVSSQPFQLTVSEPHVDARIARTSIERGKTTTLVVKLTHLQTFEGKATATLARLPRGIELVETSKEITGADKEVSFTLKAGPEALVGNYQGIVLDLTVTENGQAVRQLSGYGILRVDAERVKK